MDFLLNIVGFACPSEKTKKRKFANQVFRSFPLTIKSGIVDKLMEAKTTEWEAVSEFPGVFEIDIALNMIYST